jgi:putative OPT family oligopeptide transporter
MRDRLGELTIRGVLLGGAITLVFTAANVYLGLKVGLTFASSIPAAVISMAVLRALRKGTIQENNIVQTVASAAGTLSSVIFVLPGLVMVGWWTGFPYWETFGICAVGGVLGVMYTVPLRRAMVTTSDLPYPEGVAAAEVLIVGAGSRSDDAAEENKAGLLAVVVGSIVSAAFAAIVATRVFIDEIDVFFRSGNVATGMGLQLSLALVGAGHLIGLAVGLAMLFGLFVAWGIATPILTALHPMAGPAADVATGVWRHQVRFIGAGAIGISAIWTLAKLVAPIVGGIRSSMATSRRLAQGDPGDVPIGERDIPIKLVATIVAISIVPIAVLLASFLDGGLLAPIVVPLIVVAVIYVLVVGFLVAAVCGYMAGLIGSSNSPVSGLAILSVLGGALAVLAVAGNANADARPALVAFTLFVTAIVLCVATIANDNLQDLKTGQLVGATPWKQQLALVFGVVFGAIVIPPVLDLLNSTQGFTGGPAPSIAGAQPLAAPQATLISTLASGVIQGSLDWHLLGIGAIAGIGLILIDECLGLANLMRLPPLAVGIGIYLPASLSTPVVVGALFGWFYNRWAKRQRNADGALQLGTLLASGFIVGESLFGVLNAGLIKLTDKGAPLALVGDGFATPSKIIGTIAFFAVPAALYVWLQRIAVRSA